VHAAAEQRVRMANDGGSRYRFSRYSEDRFEAPGWTFKKYSTMGIIHRITGKGTPVEKDKFKELKMICQQQGAGISLVEFISLIDASFEGFET
jgi:hypothetical protein